MFRIHASEDESDIFIFGELQTFDHESAPPYQALSYTWDSQISPRFVYVNERRLLTRYNFYNFHNFLQAYQRNVSTDRDEQSWLWIDQPCIDQTSVAERNHQVGLMGTIFSQATVTLVWLAEEGSEGAESTGTNNIDMPLHVAAQELTSTCSTRNPVFPAGLRAYQDLPKEVQTHVLRYLIAICQNTYFTWLWIVQDIVLAGRVQIMVEDGCSQLDFHHFFVTSLQHLPYRQNERATFVHDLFVYHSHKDHKDGYSLPHCLKERGAQSLPRAS